MPIKEEDALACFRGARARVIVAEMIQARGPLCPEHIADLSGLELRTVRWAIDGYLPKYSVVHALRRLTIVRRDRRTGKYDFTAEGLAAWNAVRPALRRRADKNG